MLKKPEQKEIKTEIQRLPEEQTGVILLGVDDQLEKFEMQFNNKLDHRGN